MAPNVLTVVFKDSTGKEVGSMLINAKQFKTGSRGLFGQGKLEIEGVRYQTQVQLVEIGSKGKTVPEGEASTAQ